jgi:hypothetical protein
MDLGGQMSHYLPGHQIALASTAQNAMSYLAAQKPGETQPGVLNRPIPPSKAQTAAYNRTLGIAQQPLSILKYVKAGSLTPKDVQDLKAVYPAVYPKIVNKINQELIEHMSKGNVVPFKMRGPLGLLTGQPMDSTFTQPAMMAAQATFVPPPQPPQQGQGKSQVKKGTAKLGKTAEDAQTPLESRQKALSKA